MQSCDIIVELLNQFSSKCNVLACSAPPNTSAQHCRILENGRLSDRYRISTDTGCIVSNRIGYCCIGRYTRINAGSSTVDRIALHTMIKGRSSDPSPARRARSRACCFMVHDTGEGWGEEGRRKETVTWYQPPRDTKTAQYWFWPPSRRTPPHPGTPTHGVLVSVSVSAVVYARILVSDRIGACPYRPFSTEYVDHSTHNSATALVHALIVSRVDYCNNVLAGAPRTITNRSQWVLNAAAQVVSGTRKFDRG